jgi:sugar phosphate isomerase/epimerase
LPGVTYDQAVGYVIEVFERVMPAIAGAGIDLCLEPLAPNDTNFINTCAQAMEVIAQVAHPHFKLHMDVKAQSSEAATTVAELIGRYARFAGHFHAQDINLQGPGMGDVDFGPIMRALVEASYERWVSVEVFDFSPGALETGRRSIQCLRASLESA